MIAILGGGITGLTAAYQLQKLGKEFILFEATSKLGGKIQSYRNDQYVCELGPNTVLINNPEIKLLLEELNLWDELIFPEEKAVKNRFVLKNNKIEPIPNSLKTAFRSQLIGLGTLRYVIRELFLNPINSDKEESLADFSKRRFGQQIYEDLITPFVTGIYAGDPEKMSINYVLNILKKAENKYGSVLRGMVHLMKEKKKDGVQNSLPQQKIFSFKNGLFYLIETIENSLSKKIEKNAIIKNVEKNKSGYLLEYKQNGKTSTITVSGIISTLPSHSLSSVLGANFPVIASSISKINSVPAIAIHLGFKKGAIGFNNDAFGILSRKKESAPFLGILFNSRFFPHTSSPDNELITIICGGYKNPELITMEDELIYAKVFPWIKQLLTISQTPNFRNICKWNNGIPQYELGYREIEDTVREFEKQHQNFYVGGNFYNGISVSDCVKNGINLAKQVI